MLFLGRGGNFAVVEDEGDEEPKRSSPKAAAVVASGVGFIISAKRFV